MMLSSSSSQDNRWRLQMRKLILIAVIATMSSTSCYANLSLASNDPAQAASAQPKPQPEAAPKAAPKAVVKSSTAAKPRTRHSFGNVAPVGGYAPIGGYYHHCL